MKPQQYTKKPVTLEAMQWTGDNAVALNAWTDGAFVLSQRPILGATAMLFVAANNDWLNLETGEWVLEDARGYCPCKPDIFEQSYSEGDAGELSDGHHTFRELYEYRMLYNAHAAQGWLEADIPVVKSWRHSDGEECFGGGWFVVSAQLSTGQVTNHYRAEHWGLFNVPAVDLAPTYDGHTPAEAARRLAEYLGGDA